MKKYITIAIVALLLLCIPVFNFMVGNKEYVFPITPNDDEWNEITNKSDKVEMLQIPEDKLKSMSTKALLKTILNYPYVIDIFAYDKLNDGVENLKEFNGFSEFLIREDAPNAILELYKTNKKTTDTKDNDYDKRCNEQLVIKAIFNYLYTEKKINEELYNEFINL